MKLKRNNFDLMLKICWEIRTNPHQTKQSIADACKIDRTVVYRLLHGLCRLGLVWCEPKTNHYFCYDLDKMEGCYRESSYSL